MRRQRRCRLLEYHLHSRTEQRGFAPGQRQNFASVEPNSARVGPVQKSYAHRQCGLAGSGLSDNRQRLSRVEGQVDSIKRFEVKLLLPPPPSRVCLVQVCYPHQRLRLACARHQEFPNLKQDTICAFAVSTSFGTLLAQIGIRSAQRLSKLQCNEVNWASAPLPAMV